MNSSQADDYQQYYSRQLSDAHDFQDFVCIELGKKGIVIQNISGKKHQESVGENLLGMEIKFDKIFERTGNFYIEVAEKAHPSRRDYVPSGIYRTDNSWLFAVGNYSVLYIFGKARLRTIDAKNPDWIIRPPETPTSRGFLIPLRYAKQAAEKVVEFEKPKHDSGTFPQCAQCDARGNDAGIHYRHSEKMELCDDCFSKLSALAFNQTEFI